MVFCVVGDGGNFLEYSFDGLGRDEGRLLMKRI